MQHWSRKGHMTEVPVSPEDRRLMREIFAKAVLPRWIQRCGPQCADLWRPASDRTEAARDHARPAISSASFAEQLYAKSGKTDLSLFRTAKCRPEFPTNGFAWTNSTRLPTA